MGQVTPDRGRRGGSSSYTTTSGSGCQPPGKTCVTLTATSRGVCQTVRMACLMEEIAATAGKYWGGLS